jgi:signal peptidase II
MDRFLKSALLLFALASFVGCDQLAKTLATQRLSEAAPVALLNNLVRFVYTENPGSFMGLGSTLPPGARSLLYQATALFAFGGLIAVLLFIHRINPLNLAGLTLILAGAIGNLIDRFTNDGRVIDFVVIGVGWLHTGVFNTADLFIAAGILLVIIGTTRPRPV